MKFSRLSIKGVAVVLFTIILFYLPYSLALSLFVWLVIIAGFISRLFRKKELLFSWLCLTVLHALTLVFLFSFAPKGGGAQHVDTASWDGQTLEEVYISLEEQTGFKVHPLLGGNSNVVAFLGHTVSCEHTSLSLLQCFEYLSDQVPLSFGLKWTHGLPLSVSLSGHHGKYDIIIIPQSN